MLIQDRIKLIIKANNLSPSEFADRIGVNRSNLSHVLSGRNKPGLDFLEKIINNFPNVNASWLLSGTARKDEDQVIHINDSNKEAESVKKDLVAVEGSEIERIVVFYKNGTFKNFNQISEL